MKQTKRFFAIILAVLMGILTPVHALAASDSAEYISEITTVSAKSYSEAEKLLKAKGFIPVGEENLNSTLKTGVYLGYKTTDDPSEAITDISAMNMNGKYSYSDYKTVMERYRDRIIEVIDGFTTSVAEFCTNHENETVNALLAYQALNIYKEDDSGMLMGDYLLGFDFSDEATEELTNVIMQANGDTVLSIMRIVSFASDNEDDTMTERLSELGPDKLEKEFYAANPTVAKAKQAMEEQYGQTAGEIYGQWQSLYEYLQKAEQDLINENSDGSISAADGAFENEDVSVSAVDGLSEQDREYVENVISFGDSAEVTDDITDFSLYTLLKSTTYGKGTLLDFFNRPVNTVVISEIYPLVEVMSEAQKAQVGMVGIRDILISSYSSENKNEEMSETQAQYIEMIEEAEICSIYSGVDRSVFKDGVAFTSKATEHENLTGESWLEKLIGGKEMYKGDWKNAVVTSLFTTGGLLLVGITATLISRARVNSAIISEAQAKSAGAISITNYRNEFSMIKITDMKASDESIRSMMDSFTVESYDEARRLIADAGRATSRAKTAASVIKWASFAVLFVALIIDGVTLYKYFTAEEKPEDAIPHHILTAVTTPYGEDYVYYETVKNLSGEASDLNNHEADKNIGWLVLYFTKEANAGLPISADEIKIVVGSRDFGDDASFVHLFNETGALNTTADIYTGTADKAGGTYIVFSRDSLAAVGSAISGGAAAMIGAAGLAVGALAGIIGTKAFMKKKNGKKEDDPKKAD